MNDEDITRYTEKEIDGEIYIIKTKEWAEKQKNALYESRFAKSGLPIHSRNLAIKDYVGSNRIIPRKLSLYVNEFSTKYKNMHLYFWSHENGTQKTTMASVVGNALIQQGFSVRFILMGDLLAFLSDLNKGEETEERKEDLLNCDFLIIDDSFDRKKATIYKSGFQISFLDIFLRKRLEGIRKATCFTSNFSIDEIDEEVFGTSLKKLIKRSIPDPFEFSVLYSDRNDFDVSKLWS